MGGLGLEKAATVFSGFIVNSHFSSKYKLPGSLQGKALLLAEQPQKQKHWSPVLVNFSKAYRKKPDHLDYILSRLTAPRGSATWTPSRGCLTEQSCFALDPTAGRTASLGAGNTASSLSGAMPTHSSSSIGLGVAFKLRPLLCILVQLSTEQRLKSEGLNFLCCVCLNALLLTTKLYL